MGKEKELSAQNPKFILTEMSFELGPGQICILYTVERKFISVIKLILQTIIESSGRVILSRFLL